MFEATTKQSLNTLSMLKELLDKANIKYDKNRILYAYGTKSNIFAKKMINFALTFNEKKKEIIFLPINNDQQIMGPPIIIDHNYNVSISLDGDFTLSPDPFEKDLKITIPSYTSELADDMYQFPISQKELVEKFHYFAVQFNK